MSKMMEYGVHIRYKSQNILGLFKTADQAAKALSEYADIPLQELRRSRMKGTAQQKTGHGGQHL